MRGEGGGWEPSEFVKFSYRAPLDNHILWLHSPSAPICSGQGHIRATRRLQIWFADLAARRVANPKTRIFWRMSA